MTLESKSYGGDWTAAGPIDLAADGTFQLPVSPKTRTSYRLADGAVRAGLTTVTVAARVAASIVSAGVRGTLKPAVQSAAVQLQRANGTGWTTVSSTVTDGTGAFGFEGPIASGQYRARCAPGAAAGLAPGHLP